MNHFKKKEYIKNDIVKQKKEIKKNGGNVAKQSRQTANLQDFKHKK